MSKLNNLVITFQILFIFQLFAQKEYKYVSYPNDPLQTRIYKLENGLTVFLSKNPKEPRIYTAIAVKAGSKNDPSDATGLAHYLEHMLFKGTDRFGTKDFNQEKIYLDQIYALYEVYNQTKDETQRAKIYRQIDSVSGIAAQYAIANEYDKMVSQIGAKGTNAFTSFEQTVYINDIPSNQIEKWLKLESERFRNPIMRLFHTELEAVYEEKNISLDNDNNLAFETFFAALFPTHPYGTQTTIGTVEHLKNPSLKKIADYYRTYYVPNNMAIILAGDLDYDATITLIDKYFGKFEAKPVPPFNPPQEKPITQPIEKTVIGKEPPYVLIGFRTSSSKQDRLINQAISLLLSNEKVGLITTNLLLPQKILAGYAYYENMIDYSVFTLQGKAKEEQDLKTVKNLLLEQLELIKKGKFDEKLIPQIMNDYKKYKILQSENNPSRVFSILPAFTEGIPYEEIVNFEKELSAITKRQIIEYAKKTFNQNYVVVYKEQGTPKPAAKVPKPPINKVETNRNAQSEFFKEFSSLSAPVLEPVFVDYQKEIIKEKYQEMPIWYKKNTTNELFRCKFVVQIGRKHNKHLELLPEFFEYLNTKKYKQKEIKRRFLEYACDVDIDVTDDETIIQCVGLDSYFTNFISFFSEIIRSFQPNEKIKKEIVSDVLKLRQEAKSDKFEILYLKMAHYAKFGNTSPDLIYLISAQELQNTPCKTYTDLLATLFDYPHKFIYYGPKSVDEVKNVLAQYHKIPTKFKDIPAPKEPTYQNYDKNVVYFYQYDNMVQAEILILQKSVEFDPEVSRKAILFNEYFGGGMGSIVFQEIRESRALAYATYSRFTNPPRKGHPYFIQSYIGTQADKIHEAIKAMNELLDNPPISENLFNVAKNTLINTIISERIVNEKVLETYQSLQRYDIEEDARIKTYEYVKASNSQSIKEFNQQYYKVPKVYLVLGDKNRINVEELRQYGELKVLSPEQIFGY
ncbi:MAG: insulinase family protein [Bacteroidia bacterium]|nr:insulinase family protein [Bacteroidia bacterium]MDW8302819.1 insulinase family protein [Bacteroidia bacterium]